MPRGSSRAPLIVRNAELGDVPAIVELSSRAYKPSGIEGYREAAVIGQINNFPQGQFVCIQGDKVLGYCATFRISGEQALKPHTWVEITGGGYGSRHDPEGDYLYGMEVCVDPAVRGYRIGQRLYNARKKLCIDLHLRGIIFGGRMPGYDRLARRMDPESFVRLVQEKKARDPVLSFQLRNGFEVLGVLRRYLPADHESHGNAVHLIWHNPTMPPETPGQESPRRSRLPDTVRIGAVQYMLEPVKNLEDFLEQVRYFVAAVSDYRGDFIVFPEMFTLQLLSLEREELSSNAAIEALTRYTPALKDALRNMALRYNINIIGGSTPTKMPDSQVKNMGYVFLRDGTVHEQPKIHPTPAEAHDWGTQGGERLNVIQTDCGPVGILISYDAEFPELARHLVDQGAIILFIPFCTDERNAYMRVRHCAQARAIENQCYVVMAGNCGKLPGVANMYAQSCILTPCDFSFPLDGVAADTTPNTEMVAFADLNLQNLRLLRNTGVVQNLKDRRHGLYSVLWQGR